MPKGDRDGKQQPRSLATEKDIDPEFGLFTEEAGEGAVQEADELLLEQYPYDDATTNMKENRN